MPKIVAYIHDIAIELNGASILMQHHLHALKELGFEVECRHFREGLPADVDWVMFQSEWYDKIKKVLDSSPAKRICWVGHFKPADRFRMPLLEHIKADIYHTQWKGDCVSYAQDKLKQVIHYLPHAGCSCMKHGNKIVMTDTIFIGSKYSERDTDWLDYCNIPVTKSKLVSVADKYYSAKVCPNLHGDFQKNVVNKETMTIPGRMINDRIFQVILSGGFAISDNNPLVKEFFTEDEVPYADTKEQYKSLIDYFISHPEERIPYMEKAKEKILNQHLYTNRWKTLHSLLAQDQVNTKSELSE